MQKAKKKSLRCCYCCIEVLSGFLLLMLVASIFTLLRYFLEFSEPMPAYSGNKTNLLIGATTPPKHSHQPLLTEDLASAETLSQASDSPQEVTDSPKVPPEKTDTWIFSLLFLSVTQSPLLQGLIPSTKQKSPQQLLTLHSPQLLTSTTKLMLSRRFTSAMEQTSAPQQTLPADSTPLPVFPPHVSTTAQQSSPPKNATVASLPWLETSMKRTPHQPFPAILSTLQELAATMKRRSVSHPPSAIPWRTLPQKKTATDIFSLQQFTLAKKPNLPKPQPAAVKPGPPQNLPAAAPWQINLPRNETHSQKPFSGQSGENKNNQS